MHYHRKQPAKVKNITRTSLGDKVGRVHMKKQDLDNMKSRRVTALRNNKKRSAPGDSEENLSYREKKARKSG